jgi:hypothetical protein
MVKIIPMAFRFIEASLLRPGVARAALPRLIFLFGAGSTTAATGDGAASTCRANDASICHWLSLESLRLRVARDDDDARLHAVGMPITSSNVRFPGKSGHGPREFAPDAERIGQRVARMRANAPLPSAKTDRKGPGMSAVEPKRTPPGLEVS